MDTNATASMCIDIESTNAVHASIMATLEMMETCTLRDTGGNALKPEQAQDVDVDVDVPTNETTQANEMIVDSLQHKHVKYKVRPYTPYRKLRYQITLLTTSKYLHATTLERKPVCKPTYAPKPQHKHLKHLVRIDAKSKAPVAISLDKAVKASEQHGRSRFGPRLLASPERKRQTESRFAHAVLETIDEEAYDAAVCGARCICPVLITGMMRHMASITKKHPESRVSHG